MSIGHFEYLSPQSVAEAVELLRVHAGRARIMAGGTDLMVKIRLGAIDPDVLINIKGINALHHITLDADGGLTIGALARLSEVAAHPGINADFPAIATAARETANVQVRNMGTVIGNLCNASPSADNAPTLLVMDAAVHIAGPDGERRLPLKDFFRGPGTTALGVGELVTAVHVPPPPPRTGVVYESFSARGRLDCSAVGVGALVTLAEKTCNTVRIAVGACAPVPMRAAAAEALLVGKTPSPAALEAVSVATANETLPITDLRASADYRVKVVQVLTHRVLEAALRLAGN